MTGKERDAKVAELKSAINARKGEVNKIKNGPMAKLTEEIGALKNQIRDLKAAKVEPEKATAAAAEDKG